MFEALGRPAWYFSGTNIRVTGALGPFLKLVDYVRIVGNIVRFGPDQAYHLALLDVGVPLYRGGLEIALRYAPTPREALALLTEHAGSRHGYLRYSFGPEGSDAWRLGVTPSLPLRDAAAPLIETPLLNAHRMVCRMTGQERIGARLDLMHRKHAYSDRLIRECEGGVAFGARANALIIPAGLLDRPSMMHDPELWAIGRLRCGDESLAIMRAEGVADVRLVVDTHLAERGKVPKLKEVARRLAVAERTLLRRIRMRGLTYRQITDDLRRQRCNIMLAADRLRIGDISEALGFSDERSFRRAYYRWHGVKVGQARPIRT
jgi:AraC-like DNA-binding protein